MNVEQKTLNNIPFVKTVLMILVMAGHACAFWTGEWLGVEPAIQSPAVGTVSEWLSNFHIYAFALVSGYLFTYIVHRGGYVAYLPFLGNKAKRLLIPYVFAMLLWVAPVSAFFFHWDVPYLFQKYILCVYPSQLWFLWMLFGVFALVWPLRKWMLSKPWIGWAVSMVFFGIGTVGDFLFANVFCIWTACKYVPFFFLGMRIRQKQENGERLYARPEGWLAWLIAYTILFIAARFVDRNASVFMKLIRFGLDFSLHFVGAVINGF